MRRPVFVLNERKPFRQHVRCRPQTYPFNDVGLTSAQAFDERVQPYKRHRIANSIVLWLR